MKDIVNNPMQARNAVMLSSLIELIAMNLHNASLKTIHKEGYTPISMSEARAMAFAVVSKKIAHGHEDTLSHAVW